MFRYLFLLTLILLHQHTSGEESAPAKKKYDMSQIAFVVLSQSHPRHAAIGDETKAILVTIEWDPKSPDLKIKSYSLNYNILKLVSYRWTS